MTMSALAGKPAPKGMLVDLIRLEREYYAGQPDMGDPNLRTSGHRGSPFAGAFTEAHIAAITQACAGPGAPGVGIRGRARDRAASGRAQSW